MVYGTNALVVKPAISLTPMFVVAILNSYGYNELKKNTLTGDQLAYLKHVMFLLVCFYPVILGVLQMITWSFYTVRDSKDKKRFEETIPVASCKC